MKLQRKRRRRCYVCVRPSVCLHAESAILDSVVSSYQYEDNAFHPVGRSQLYLFVNYSLKKISLSALNLSLHVSANSTSVFVSALSASQFQRSPRPRLSKETETFSCNKLPCIKRVGGEGRVRGRGGQVRTISFVNKIKNIGHSLYDCW